jgi:hypothetical protein
MATYTQGLAFTTWEPLEMRDFLTAPQTPSVTTAVQRKATKWPLQLAYRSPSPYQLGGPLLDYYYFETAS